MSNLLEKFIEKYGRLPTEVDPDYLEMLEMSKYRITNHPDFKPHKCANCGAYKDDGRKYVDFGCEVDWFGTVFLCGICVKDVATELGIIPREEVNTEDPVPRLHKEIEVSVNKLEQVLKEFHDYGVAIGISLNPISLDSSTDDSSVSTTTEPRTDKAESGITESSTGSRRKNIRSLTELLNS